MNLTNDSRFKERLEKAIEARARLTDYFVPVQGLVRPALAYLAELDGAQARLILGDINVSVKGRGGGVRVSAENLVEADRVCQMLRKTTPPDVHFRWSTRVTIITALYAYAEHILAAAQ
ncbi:hypothetical protein [Caulobacter sp. 17J65-9]|uniref:hypothetical protein n=1 Tax=Caulobacter sp. 17J65-9 TaxID=2709382 RepID=UPI0013CDABE8|nr:hypothetical protein [Caulobacter sp. 17J65-9]NEX91222.1 hypothetical protein [Caulobacter sp. 17J65-9]